MEIRNKTLYDKNLILNYNKYYLTSYIKRNFIIISIISALFIIYMLAIQQWLYALMLFGILIFYLVLTYFMQKLTTNRILKRSPLVEQPVMQTYLFRDNDFEVKNMKAIIVNYQDIIKFKETSQFYLLQSRDRKTYIVDYNGFDSELDRQSFDDFMKSMYLKKRP